MKIGAPIPIRIGAVAFVLAAAAGCQGESVDLPNDLVWKSSHFVFHARAEDSALCPDVLFRLEQHFSALQALLGFVWPDERRIQYYKFLDRSDFNAHARCASGADGCADSVEAVYSHRAFEEHELVHAYLWRSGVPPPVITEGTAVALSCDRAIPAQPSLSLNDAVRVRDALSDTRVYETGGRLVRFLLDRYGARTFMRFYSQLAFDATVDDLDRTARSVFGSGADAIWAAALATPASCAPAFACSRDALPLDGTPVTLFPVCGVPDQFLTLNLAADAQLAIAGPLSTSVGGCDGNSPASGRIIGYGGSGDQVGMLTLPAGHYYVDAPSSTPADLSVRQALEPWTGDDCSALVPFVFGPGQYADLRVMLPSSVAKIALKLSFADPHLLSVQAYAPSPRTTTVTVCSDCDTSSISCQHVGPSHEDVLWQGDYVVTLEASSTGPGAYLDILGR